MISVEMLQVVGNLPIQVANPHHNEVMIMLMIPHIIHPSAGL